MPLFFWTIEVAELVRRKVPSQAEIERKNVKLDKTQLRLRVCEEGS